MASPKTTLFAGRAQRFLRLLANKPFVAIVAKGSTAEVYFKGMDQREAEGVILQALAEVMDNPTETEGDSE